MAAVLRCDGVAHRTGKILRHADRGRDGCRFADCEIRGQCGHIGFGRQGHGDPVADRVSFSRSDREVLQPFCAAFHPTVRRQVNAEVGGNFFRLAGNGRPVGAGNVKSAVLILLPKAVVHNRPCDRGVARPPGGGGALIGPSLWPVLVAGINFDYAADRNVLDCIPPVRCNKFFGIGCIVCDQSRSLRIAAVARVPVGLSHRGPVKQGIFAEIHFLPRFKAGLGHLIGMGDRILNRLPDQGEVFARNFFNTGDISDIFHRPAGDGGNPGQAGDIPPEVERKMIAVSCQGIPDIAGSHILYRRAGGNDEINPGVGQNLLLHGRGNGVIHGCLIAVITWEIAVVAAGLIRPGHVPPEFGVRIGLFLLHIVDQVVEIAVVGVGHAAETANLLQRDVVPVLVLDTIFHCGLRPGVPASVSILAVVIGRLVSRSVRPVRGKAATADIQIAEDDLLRAAVGRQLIQMLGCVVAEAVADGKDPKGFRFLRFGGTCRARRQGGRQNQTESAQGRQHLFKERHCAKTPFNPIFPCYFTIRIRAFPI